MAKKQGSDENVKSPSWILTPFWIELFWAQITWKCLILQLQNGFICSNRCRNSFARHESIKQWLVALVTPSWIIPPYWSFEKSYFYDIFLWIDVFKSKVSNDLVKVDWIMEYSRLMAILNFSAILKCYYSKFIIYSFYGPDPDYINMSLDQLIITARNGFFLQLLSH
jgi:hypothetical protein